MSNDTKPIAVVIDEVLAAGGAVELELLVKRETCRAIGRVTIDGVVNAQYPQLIGRVHPRGEDLLELATARFRQLSKHPHLRKLGQEPLSDDESFGIQYLLVDGTAKVTLSRGSSEAEGWVANNEAVEAAADLAARIEHEAMLNCPI